MSNLLSGPLPVGIEKRPFCSPRVLFREYNESSAMADIIALSDTAKIVLTALISSMFTAALSEPLKAYVSQRLRLARLRRILIAELSHNFHVLAHVLYLARVSDVEIGEREMINLRTARYEMAKKDPDFFYDLPEADMFNLFYQKLDDLFSDESADREDKIEHLQCVLDDVCEDLLRHKKARRIVMRIGDELFKEAVKRHEPYRAWAREESLAFFDNRRGMNGDGI